MIEFTQIARHKLQTQPYAWGAVSNLFLPKDAKELAASFPRDYFKTVASYGGEKDYAYEARELIAMGAMTISQPEELNAAWLGLAHDLLSPAYRIAMSLLTGCDLITVPMEVNLFHYGPGACLGPHPDLDDKLVTHVIYFNQSWDSKDGGCLTILGSADPTDITAEIAPIVGNSVVLVRSNNSWHAVSRVLTTCRTSRRSLTLTFYRSGSVSTMWPPHDNTPLHSFEASDLETQTPRLTNLWARWRRKVASWKP